MGHPAQEIGFAALESMGRFHACKHIEYSRYDPSPSSLMAGSEPCAVVPVEIFVEKNVILPMLIFLKLLSSAIDGPPPVGITYENGR
jgi:hypothetical protein